MQCVDLWFVIKVLAKWRESMVLIFFQLVTKRFWRSTENGFLKMCGNPVFAMDLLCKTICTLTSCTGLSCKVPLSTAENMHWNYFTTCLQTQWLTNWSSFCAAFWLKLFSVKSGWETFGHPDANLTILLRFRHSRPTTSSSVCDQHTWGDYITNVIDYDYTVSNHDYNRDYICLETSSERKQNPFDVSIFSDNIRYERMEERNYESLNVNTKKENSQ